jgi:hypothetical protein
MELATLRRCLTEDLVDTLTGLINRKAGERARYWILVHAAWRGETILNTKIIVSPKRPPAFIDSMLFEIDNKRGTIRIMVCAPADVPMPDADWLQDSPTEDVRNTLEKTGLKVAL